MAVLDKGADDLGRGRQLVFELQPREAALVGAAHLGADFVDVDERGHVALDVGVSFLSSMSRTTSTEGQQQRPAADGMSSWFGAGFWTGCAPANSRFRKSSRSSTGYWSSAPKALAGMKG